MSTTSTSSEYSEHEVIESQYAGKFTIYKGPHTKGQPFEVQIALSQGLDRDTLDRFKSYIGSPIGLNTAKRNEDRKKPGNLTLTMNDDVRETRKALKIAIECVRRNVKFVDRQFTQEVAWAIHSDVTRNEMMN